MDRVDRRLWVYVAVGLLGCGFCVSVDPLNWIAWLFGVVFLLGMMGRAGRGR